MLVVTLTATPTTAPKATLAATPRLHSMTTHQGYAYNFYSDLYMPKYIIGT